MGSSFKENLKEILEFKDMTVKELAYRTGISDRSIGNYLNSRESMPPADYAYRIAKALGTTVEFLITGKDSKGKSQIFPENLRTIICNFSKMTPKNQDLLSKLSSSLAEK